MPVSQHKAKRSVVGGILRIITKIISFIFIVWLISVAIGCAILIIKSQSVSLENLIKLNEDQAVWLNTHAIFCFQKSIVQWFFYLRQSIDEYLDNHINYQTLFNEHKSDDRVGQ